jgi:hypothetical protein
MNFDKVIHGIVKYLDNEIYSNMTDWQEVLARIAVGRMIGDTSELKKTLMDNSFVKTFAIMDEHGDVDVDGLMRDLKNQIAQKGKIDISIPLLGKFTFTSEDVDELHRTIDEFD